MSGKGLGSERSLVKGNGQNTMFGIGLTVNQDKRSGKGSEQNRSEQNVL